MSSTDQQTARPSEAPPAEPEAPEILELAGEFPAADRAQWRGPGGGGVREGRGGGGARPGGKGVRRAAGTGGTGGPPSTAPDPRGPPAPGGGPRRAPAV